MRGAHAPMMMKRGLRPRRTPEAAQEPPGAAQEPPEAGQEHPAPRKSPEPPQAWGLIPIMVLVFVILGV